MMIMSQIIKSQWREPLPAVTILIPLVGSKQMLILAALNTNHERPMIDVFNPGLQWYADKLNAGDPYTWIRLGDGEWSAIKQDRGRTSSRSQTLNHKSLQQGMIKVITKAPDDPRYILSLRQTSYRAKIQGWLDQHAPEYIRWHDCTVLYKASKKGNLYPWIAALRNLAVPIVVIGPERHA
ncbi:unnamed protein product, partial [marine sediment metagenome]